MSSSAATQATPVWGDDSVKLLSFDEGESLPGGITATGYPSDYDGGIRPVSVISDHIKQGDIPKSGCGQAIWYQASVVATLSGIWTGRGLMIDDGGQPGTVGELTRSSAVAKNTYSSIAGLYKTCDKTPPPVPSDEQIKSYKASSLHLDCGGFECVSQRVDVVGTSSGSTFYTTAWSTTLLSGNLVLTVPMRSLGGEGKAPTRSDADFQQLLSAQIGKLKSAVHFASK